MSITLSRGGTDIELPPTLEWPNRYSWPTKVGANTRGLTGRLIVQTADRFLGRDITLQTGELQDGFCGIVSRETAESIKAIHELSDADMALIIDDEIFDVRWNRTEQGGFTMRPLIAPRAAGQDLVEDPFAITMRFFTVS